MKKIFKIVEKIFMVAKHHKVELMLIAILVLVFGMTAAQAHDKGEPKKPSSKKVALKDGILKYKEPTTPITIDKHTTFPEDAPENPYEKVEIKQIGLISIPKIGMTQKLYEGVWLTVLDQGPGHWPGSSMPGEYGNSVIAGHRVTHSRPFNRIDELRAGDEIIVTTQDGSFVYKYRETKVVYPEDIWIVNQTDNYQLTLFACHPKGSAKQRIVVFADLVR